MKMENLIKKCIKCKCNKQLKEFCKDNSRKDGLQLICKECKKKLGATHYIKNKEKIKSQVRIYDLKVDHGITIEMFNEMFENQNGCCYICGKHQKDLNRSLCVDHNHTTGQIRGLLCHSCNFILGFAYENIDTLKKSIEYLEIYNKI